MDNIKYKISEHWFEIVRIKEVQKKVLISVPLKRDTNDAYYIIFFN